MEEPPPTGDRRGGPPLGARIAGGRDRATAVADHHIGVLRDQHDLVDAVLEAADLDRRRAGGLLAGGIAFRAFIWLLPATLLATGILGIVHRASPESPQELATDSGLGGVVASSVSNASSQSGRGTAVLIVIGAVLTVYTAMSLVRALRLAFVLAWGLPIVKRPGLPREATLFSLAILGQIVLSGVASWVRAETAIAGVVVSVLVPLAGAGIWLWISWRLPHADVPLRAIVPGALLIYAGLQAMHLVTVYYLADRLEDASRLYGALGIAATLLLWLYLVSRLIVASAFLNATLWYRSHPRPESYIG